MSDPLRRRHDRPRHHAPHYRPLRVLLAAAGVAVLASVADPAGAIGAAPRFDSSVNCRRGVLSVVIMPPPRTSIRRVEFYLGSKRVHVDRAAPFFLSTVPVGGPSHVLPEDGKVIKVHYPMHLTMKIYYGSVGHLLLRKMDVVAGACRPGSSKTK
jgi:hypothetical protein